MTQPRSTHVHTSGPEALNSFLGPARAEMDQWRQELADVIWRKGVRVQTGRWYASMGVILDTLSTWTEERIVEICERSQPAHDRRDQEIVFELHKEP